MAKRKPAIKKRKRVLKAAISPKPKKLPKSRAQAKPKRAKITGLQPGERLIVRGVKGKFTKYRSDRPLIFEIRAKGKKPRFLNMKDKKTGKPIPRRLTAFQKKYLTTRRQPSLKQQVVTSHTLRVNSSEPIIDQLWANRRPILNMIRANITKNKGAVGVYTELTTDLLERFRSIMVIIGPKMRDEDIIKLIAVDMIVNPIRDNSLRISPKIHARSEREKKRREVPFATIEIVVAKF